MNSFCSSAAFLGDGRLLVSGGNSPLDSNEFTPSDGTVTTALSRMADERWYATMLALSDGRLLILGGSTPYGALRAYQDPLAAINAGTVSMTPELFEPGIGWRSLFGAQSRDAFGPDHHRYWYPRAWLAPNGEVFGISSEKMWYLAAGGNGSIRVVGNFKTGVNATTRPNIGPTSAAVMFAPGRVLQVGGNGYHDGHATPSSALATVVDFDGSTAVMTETAAMSFARQWPSATVLPNGRVVVTGGTRFGNNGAADAVYEAELWNPATGTWTVGARAAQIRVYHSAAILMPNGTVLSTGGGAPGPVNNLNAELYYPPYLFRAATGGGAELAPRPGAHGRKRAQGELRRDARGQPVAERCGRQSRADRSELGDALVQHDAAASGARRFCRRAHGSRSGCPRAQTARHRATTCCSSSMPRACPPQGLILAIGPSTAPPPVPTVLPRGNRITLESVNLPGNVIGTDAAALGVLKPLGANPSPAELAQCGILGARRPCRFALRFARIGRNARPVAAPPGLPAQALRERRHRSLQERRHLLSGGRPRRNGRHAALEKLPGERAPTPRPRALDRSGHDGRRRSRSTRPSRCASGRGCCSPRSPRRPCASGPRASYAPAQMEPGLLYQWDFGDGTTTPLSSSPAASHLYAAPGIYLVSVTARAPDGVTSTKTFAQVVYPPPVTGTPRASSPLALEPRATGAARLWAVNPDNNTVSVFDTGTGARLAETTVGNAPRSVAVAPDGRIWVVNRDSHVDFNRQRVDARRGLDRGDATRVAAVRARVRAEQPECVRDARGFGTRAQAERRERRDAHESRRRVEPAEAVDHGGRLAPPRLAFRDSAAPGRSHRDAANVGGRRRGRRRAALEHGDHDAPSGSRTADSRTAPFRAGASRITSGLP